MSLNSWSSWFRITNAGVTGMSHCAWLLIFISVNNFPLWTKGINILHKYAWYLSLELSFWEFTLSKVQHNEGEMHPLLYDRRGKPALIAIEWHRWNKPYHICRKRHFRSSRLRTRDAKRVLAHPVCVTGDAVRGIQSRQTFYQLSQIPAPHTWK